MRKIASTSECFGYLMILQGLQNNLCVWYICSFLGYRSIWSMKVCVTVVFMWTHVHCEILQLCWLGVSHNVSPVISSATASISAWNSWRLCGVVQYTCPINRTTNIQSAMKLFWQDNGHQAHHAAHPRHLLYMDMHHPAGKMCPHALLHEWEMICYGTLHRDWFNKPLLADCTPHHAFFRMEWFLEAQDLVFCLFTNPSRWKWASSPNHKWWDTAAQTVRSLMFALVIGCSEHLYHLYFVKIQHQILSHDGMCCYFDTKWLRTSCHRFSWTLKQHLVYMSNIVLHACWPVVSYHTFLVIADSTS